MFVGRVTAFTSDVEFEVEQAFSGVKSGRITIENGPGTCGYSFAIGERYIVYAGRNRSTGALSTGLCTRTRPLSDPRTRADLAYFARGKRRGDEPLLTGVVSDVTAHLAAATAATRRPLPGIKVTATPLAGGRSRTTTTRVDGSYEFTDIGVGRFSVTASLPPQFEPHQPVTVTIDDIIAEKLVVIVACAEADFGARSDGRISGQLLDERNQPLRDVAVQLANPAHARAEAPMLRTIGTLTDAQGRYEFRNVGPGQYVVGIDLQRPLRPGTLNRRRFYSQRSDTAAAAATVVELKTAERRELPPFRLPPLPADRHITVVVQAPTQDVARETTIFLTGATREPIAHTGDPLPLRLPFGAFYMIDAVPPKGYRIVQPAGVGGYGQDDRIQGRKGRESREAMKRLLIVGVVFGLWAQTSTTSQPSQTLAWQAATGPFTGTVNVLAEGDGDAVFAWVGLEVFRSRNDGLTWTRCAGQPYHKSEPALLDRWLVNVGRRLYASGSHNGPMKVTEDECDSWRPISRPPAPPAETGQVIAVNGVLLAAYSRADFFTSRDGGATWLPGALPGGVTPRLATRDRTAYLVLSQRLYRSTDEGTTWAELARDGPNFHAIVPGGRNLLATASGGIWRSEDNGATWERVLETGLTAITARGPKIFAAVFNPAALARSLDDGRTWTRQTMPVPKSGAFALLTTRRGTLLAGTGRGIFRSTDDGETWTAMGVPGHQVKTLAARRGRAYASIIDGSLWQSDDSGATWSPIDWTFVGSERPLQWFGFRTLHVLDDGARLRAGTERELVASEDGGRTWSTSGLSKGVNALIHAKDAWYAGTWQGVFRSEDTSRWTECSSGLESGSIRDLIATPDGDLIALETRGRLYRSTDGCRSWWPLTVPSPRVVSMLPLLANDDALGLMLFGDGIAQLSRDQRAWIVRAELPVITAFARDGQGRYWLATRDGVSRLSVEEPKWRVIPTGLDGRVSALAFDPDGYLIAAVEGRGVFRARLP